MPTPSSRGESESVNFNSTCPDDQAPRAQPGWVSTSLPPHEEGSPSTTDIAGSNETSTAGDGSSTPQEQQLSDSGSESRLARSFSTMSPTAPLGSDEPSAPESESTFLNDSGQNDTTDKQSDTDEDMHDTHANRTTSENHDGHSTRSEHHSLRSVMVRSSGPVDTREASQYSIPETDVWDAYDTNPSPGRQLHTESIINNSRAPAGVDALSPSLDGGKAEDQDLKSDVAWPEDSQSFVGCDPTSLRVIPSSPSTFLRPGSRFVGTQQSERQVYDVQVEIKHVDLRESFLCGYLRIQGLTQDHPTLTTYFEGEIIGSKYGFNTKHKSWGANDRIDMSHWAKFAAFRQFAKQAKKGNFMIKEFLQKENIFMRWKEHFLVPDHRVRTIHGASFEGFYYICFNQVEGVVHGIYFHSKSEKFQQLELKHVEDRGCMSAVEFR